MVQHVFEHLLPRAAQRSRGRAQSLDALLDSYGFDRVQHEQIQADLRSGRIGLAQNRLPVTSRIDDVARGRCRRRHRRACRRAIANRHGGAGRGTVAVVSLAGGAGSRWTQGAGVVKALNPFCKLGGRHRNFIEVHLAKSRRTSRICGTPLPHVITTSYLTHDAIDGHLRGREQLRLSRPAAALAGAHHRPAHGSHGARPALCLGGDAAANARRAGAKSPRKPARQR